MVEVFVDVIQEARREVQIPAIRPLEESSCATLRKWFGGREIDQSVKIPVAASHWPHRHL